MNFRIFIIEPIISILGLIIFETNFRILKKFKFF